MIIFLILFIFILYLSSSCSMFMNEKFNDEENMNMYNYCVNNFNLRNCVPTKKCLEFGFNNICS